jgi:hypothetical protein
MRRAGPSGPATRPSGKASAAARRPKTGANRSGGMPPSRVPACARACSAPRSPTCSTTKCPTHGARTVSSTSVRGPLCGAIFRAFEAHPTHQTAVASRLWQVKIAKTHSIMRKVDNARHSSQACKPSTKAGHSHSLSFASRSSVWPTQTANDCPNQGFHNGLSITTWLRSGDVSCAGADCCSGEPADGCSASTSKQSAKSSPRTSAQEAAAHGTLPWIVIVCASTSPKQKGNEHGNNSQAVLHSNLTLRYGTRHTRS